MADTESVSINQFLSTVIAERIGELKALRHVRQRIGRANPATATAALALVPGRAPLEGNAHPDGAGFDNDDLSSSLYIPKFGARAGCTRNHTRGSEPPRSIRLRARFFSVNVAPEQASASRGNMLRSNVRLSGAMSSRVRPQLPYSVEKTPGRAEAG